MKLFNYYTEIGITTLTLYYISQSFMLTRQGFWINLMKIRIMYLVTYLNPETVYKYLL